MNATCYCGVVLTLATFSTQAWANPLAPPAAASVCTVLERGPDSQLVQNLVFVTNATGDVLVQTNLYTALETGMHYHEEENGPWLESRAEFIITPEGAAATQGRHRLYLPANLNQGEIRLITADGKTLRSRPLGLCYFDSQTGQSVLLAELKDSLGQLVAPDRVIWPDAFTDIRAEVVATYSKAGFECDIVLRPAPPPPEAYGLNSQSSHLQVLTEFFDPPVPVKLTQPPGKRNELANEDLDFGAMRMVKGKSFMVGDPVADSDMVPVAKQWLKLDGRDCLIESVPVRLIQAQLEALQAAVQPVGQTNVAVVSIRQRPSLQRLLPARRVVQRSSGPPIQVARAALDSRPGLAIDYLILNSTHTVLKGDTCYLVMGLVSVSSLTIEGGTCVKFTNASWAKININGTIDCQTGPYRPAVFTSYSDDTVGEIIFASTGSPGNHGNGLMINSTGQTLKNLRFSYAISAITLGFHEGQLNLAHGQFVNCQYPIDSSSEYGNTIEVDNCLFYISTYVIKGLDDLIVRGRHLTVDQCTKFGDLCCSELYLTNSLMVSLAGGYGNFNPIHTDNTPDPADLNPDPGVFQTVGAGGHYLAVNSPYRNQLIENISRGLRAELLKKTTYPPTDLSSQPISSDTILTPTSHTPFCLRDHGEFSLDLGFHYDVLDYVVSNVNVNNNARLTVTNGTAIGVYGATGFYLRSGAKLVSEGSPSVPNRFVRYQAVQEKSIVWGNTAAAMSLFCVTSNSTILPEVQMRFTDLSLLADPTSRRHIFYNYTDYQLSTLAFTDCQLRGGRIVLSLYPLSGDSRVMTVGLTNNLVQRAHISLDQDTDTGTTRLVAHARNNLFLTGTIRFADYTGTGTWSVKDNQFDTVSLSGESVPNSYNGYVSTTLLPGSSNHKVITPPPADYQVGTLGRFYYPSTGGKLSQLINAGSRTATQASLANYTTQLDSTPDTGTVDIGLHSKVFPIRPGFDQSGLPPYDDGSSDLFFTDPITLPFNFNFFGTSYSTIYINNNGNVTFDESLPAFTPVELVNVVPARDIIAACWADVDTRACGSGMVRFGNGSVDAKTAFGVNWVDVGYYNTKDNRLNTFQLVLIERSDRASGDYDVEFNYSQVQWEAGDSQFSGGNGDGLWVGPQGGPVRAGFASISNSTFEFNGSGVRLAFLDFTSTTGLIFHSFNSPVPGRYVFQFHNGVPLGTP